MKKLMMKRRMLHRNRYTYVEVQTYGLRKTIEWNWNSITINPQWSVTSKCTMSKNLNFTIKIKIPELIKYTYNIPQIMSTTNFDQRMSPTITDNKCLDINAFPLFAKRLPVVLPLTSFCQGKRPWQYSWTAGPSLILQHYNNSISTRF